MNKATIVSALFNIEREVMDGRPWEEYLKWFDIFLKLKTPMVLFVTCLLYTSPSPRDYAAARMPSSA